MQNKLIITSSAASSNFYHHIWLQSNLNRSAKITPYLTTCAKLPILDFGAGDGFFTETLCNNGFDCTALEARDENLSLMREKRSIEGTKFNLESADFSMLSKPLYTSLILGLLYHLENPYEALKNISKISQTIIIDTVCLDHDGIALVRLDENKDISGNSISGKACRPSPKWLHSTLKEFGFSLDKDFSSFDMNIPQHDGSTGHLYSWEFQGTCGWRRNECQLRKMFAYRRT